MLRNVSYTDPAIDAEIEAAVGSPFSIMQRLKMGGIGSQRMIILEASAEIASYLALQKNNLPYCSIELRPKGVIIRFRALLETHAWVIPFRMLTVFRNGNTYSLHSGGVVLKLTGLNGAAPDHAFMLKLLERKANHSA